MSAEDIIAGIIDRRRSQQKISPAWVATEAMAEINEISICSAPETYRLAHAQAKQIARDRLRKLFQPTDKGVGEADGLFPDLQWRYPTAKTAYSGEDPEYVLLGFMTDADVGYNVARLRAEADAKNKHADALEAWGRDRPIRA